MLNPNDYFIRLLPYRSAQGTEFEHIQLVNPGPSQVIYSGQHSSFLVSALVPHPILHRTHVILTITKYGLFTRFGLLQPDRLPNGSSAHFVSLSHASDRVRANTGFRLTVRTVSGGRSELILHFRLGSLDFGRNGATPAKRGTVYRISVTFLPFVRVVDGLGPRIVSRETISATFLLRMHCYRKNRKIPFRLFPRNEIRLAASVLPFRGGGMSLDLYAMGIPSSFRRIAEEQRVETGEEVCRGVRERFDALIEEVEVGKGESEGRISDLEFSALFLSLERSLESQSPSNDPHFEPESGTFWPVAVPVSNPMVNVTMDGSCPVLRSRNVLLGSQIVVTAGQPSVVPPDHFIDGLLRREDITQEFLEQKRRELIVGKAEDFGLRECIADGPNGMIHECSEFPNLFVLKTARPESGIFGEIQLLTEAMVWEKLSQVNLSPLFVRCVDWQGRLGILLYRYQGDGSSWLRTENSGDRMSCERKLSLLLSLAREIQKIHDCGFAHCDLKLENILGVGRCRGVDVPHIVVCDFGLSVDWRVCKKGISRRGTPGYMPSEFDCDPRKIDVHSFAITAWEIWTQSRAYPNEKREIAEFLLQAQFLGSVEDLRSLAVERLLDSIRGRRPNLSCVECDGMPEDLKRLLRVCWSENPDERPFIDDAVSCLTELSHEEDEETLGGTRSQVATSYFYRGRALDQVSCSEEAMRCYSRAIELDPQHQLQEFRRLVEEDPTRKNEVLSVCSRAAERQIPLGKKEEAIFLYSMMTELDPTNPEPFLKRGLLSLELHGIEHILIAHSDFVRVLKLDSACFGAKKEGVLSSYWRAADRFVSLHKKQEALSVYSMIVQLDSKNALAHFHHGSILLEIGRIVDALSAFMKVKELDSTLFEHREVLRVIHETVEPLSFSSSSWSKVLGVYSRMIQSGSSDFLAYFNRGRHYLARHRLEESYSDFLKARELDPTLFDAQKDGVMSDFLQMTHFLVAEGKKEEALSGYSMMIELDPMQVIAHLKRGLLYLDLHRIDQSQLDLDKVLELDPALSDDWKEEILSACGQAAERISFLGKHEEAICVYSMMIRVEPESSVSYFKRALLLLKLDRVEDFDSDFLKVEELDPIFFEQQKKEVLSTYSHAAGRLVADGKKEEALSVFSVMIRLDPTDAEWYFRRGLLLLEFHRNDESEIDFHKAEKLDSNLFESIKAGAISDYLERADGLAGHGRNDEAISVYLTMMQLDFKQALVSFVQTAERLVSLGKRRHAVSLYTMMIQMDPKNAVFYFNRGLLLYKLHRKEESHYDFVRAEELDLALFEAKKKEVLSANSQTVERLLSLGKKEKVLSVYSMMIHLEGTNAELYFNRGILLMELYREKKSHSDFVKAKELDGSLLAFEERFCSAADQFVSQGRRNSALFLYSMMIESDSCSARIHYRRADLLRKAYRYEEALCDYSKAIRLEQNDPYFYLARGKLLWKMVRPKDAVRDYSQAIRLLPEPAAKIFYNRGLVRDRLGRNRAAVRDYSRAIRLGKKSTEARQLSPNSELDFAKTYGNRARLLYKLGRKEESLSDFSMAIDLSTSYCHSEYMQHAELLCEFGRHEEALLDYSKAITEAPKWVSREDLLLKRANILCDLGKKEEALLEYSKVIEELGETHLAPSRRVKCHIRRGDLLRDLGRMEEALLEYESGIQSTTRLYCDARSECHIRRGDLLCDLLRKEEALSDFEKAAVSCSWNKRAEYRFRCGNLLCDLGRKEESLSAYTLAICCSYGMNADLIRFYLTRGNVHYDLGQKRNAVTDYNEAFALDPYCLSSARRLDVVVESLTTKWRTIGLVGDSISLATSDLWLAISGPSKAPSYVYFFPQKSSPGDGLYGHYLPPPQVPRNRFANVLAQSSMLHKPREKVRLRPAVPSRAFAFGDLFRNAQIGRQRVCLNCGKRNPGNRCSKCRSAYYCGAVCQRAHWGRHRKTCVQTNMKARLCT